MGEAAKKNGLNVVVSGLTAGFVTLTGNFLGGNGEIDQSTIDKFNSEASARMEQSQELDYRNSPEGQKEILTVNISANENLVEISTKERDKIIIPVLSFDENCLDDKEPCEITEDQQKELDERDALQAEYNRLDSEIRSLNKNIERWTQLFNSL